VSRTGQWVFDLQQMPAHEEGWNAARASGKRNPGPNPHPPGTAKAEAWALGWRDYVVDHEEREPEEP
jgi:hypothetical protein